MENVHRFSFSFAFAVAFPIFIHCPSAGRDSLEMRLRGERRHATIARLYAFKKGYYILRIYKAGIFI